MFLMSLRTKEVGKMAIRRVNISDHFMVPWSALSSILFDLCEGASPLVV